MSTIQVLTRLFVLCYTASAFPSSLRERNPSDSDSGPVLDGVNIATIVMPPPPPGPMAFDGTKLVDDPSHPYIPPRRGDARGPCPGLNTLANHGYLPRTGVAAPAQIIRACMEGFNMHNSIVRIATFTGHLGNGNPLTDLLSIGGKTSRTGADPPGPALVGGLNTHGTFELTRRDAFFGNNHVPDWSLFNQFKEFSERYGGGYYNYTVAAELRRHRILQSIAQNPEFRMLGDRHNSVYSESAFTANLFVDGRITERPPHHLDMASAESFFMHHRYPRGFWRPAAPTAAEGAVDFIYAAYPIPPGTNVAGVNTFEEDLSRGSLIDPCGNYQGFVNFTVRKQNPNPSGMFRRNLNINLQYLYDAWVASGLTNCEQLYPYG